MDTAKVNSIVEEQIQAIKRKCERIKPLVVIRCITYNHEPYLREALEGFIMQKTDFPFVAVVHDDASTDNTAKVLKEYAQKYPDVILPIYEQENQYQKRDGSLQRIMNDACMATGAKFIAFCEGDDYWTDSLKLQKQIDFLETHPEIGYTCHRFMIQERDLPKLTLASNSFLDKYPKVDGFEFDFEYNFKNEWITKTLTSVFRIELNSLHELQDCYFYRDVHRIYEILSKTNGYCFQFVGGVYRKQATGVWSQTNNRENALIEVKTWESIYKKYPNKINMWKIKNNYKRYVLLSFKQKKLFKIQNFRQFLLVLTFSIEFLRKEIKSYR